jgi:uroporphyrinogen-III decarboxylase
VTNLPAGERVIRCFLGEPIDHVPFGVGIGWATWWETLENWKKASGNPNLNIGQEIGADNDAAHVAVKYGIFPYFEPQVLEQNDSYTVVRNESGITYRTRAGCITMPEYLDYPVKTYDDWVKLREERLQFSAPGRMDFDWEAFRATIARTGEMVIVGCFPWGVFGTARDLMGAEELLVAFHDQPRLVHEMMEHMTGLWLDIYGAIAKEVQIDHIHIWEDMSGKQGSLISPRMVRDFMMPCYDRIAAFAKENGVRLVSVDTDGNCAELVPIMMEHGVNVMTPFEVQAGNDIREYRKQYPTLGIWGGLDKRVLGGTRADVDREIAKAAWMIERGRYIPCCDHHIPPEATWENFKYYATEIKKLCYGAHGA